MRFNAAANEDSYEAALRAADALFARAPSTAPTRTDEHQQPPSPRRMSAAPHAPTVPDEVESSKAPPSGSGRILRSLEELPAIATDQDEAVAPKRRGRKPGSKNKPKVTLTEVASPIEPRDMPAYIQAGLLAAPVHGETSGCLPVPAPRVFRAAVNGRAAAANAARGALRPAPTPSVQRFAWVRTKLAPGERWKRRLPKVIW